jgi:hypothetical protein
MKKELLKVDNSTIYELDHNMLSLEIEGHEPIHAHYTSESVIEDLKQISGCLQRIDNFKKSEKLIDFLEK